MHKKIHRTKHAKNFFIPRPNFVRNSSMERPRRSQKNDERVGIREILRSNPATRYYSAFYGRGIIQLTWAGNYKTYGEYRSFIPHRGNYIERLPDTTPRISQNSKHYTYHPDDKGLEIIWAPRFDPDIVAENKYNACDSGGFYWTSKRFSLGININRIADKEFSPKNISIINKLVNGGGNGYYERFAYSYYTKRQVMDEIDDNKEITVTPPHPRREILIDMTKPE